MCYHTQLTLPAEALERRFAAAFVDPSAYAPSAHFNGFEHPLTPIVAWDAPERIVMARWGLIPHWAKNPDIGRSTLNARVETLGERPAFHEAAHRRCLVLVDGFYEWQWLDLKGKRKQRYRIRLPDGAAFALCGIVSDWIDPAAGVRRRTYAILTTEADELMSRIHNSKRRMPLALPPGFESLWLEGAVERPLPMTWIAELA